MKKVYLVSAIVVWKNVKGDGFQGRVTKAFSTKEKKDNYLSLIKKDSLSTDELKKILKDKYRVGDTFEKLDGIFVEEYEVN